MHQRAGVKLHHGWMPNATQGGLLLRDKQDEKRIASPANVPETSSVALPSVLLASIDPPAEAQLPFQGSTCPFWAGRDGWTGKRLQ